MMMSVVVGNTRLVNYTMLGKYTMVMSLFSSPSYLQDGDNERQDQNEDDVDNVDDDIRVSYVFVRASSVGVDEDDVGDAITQGYFPPSK